MGKFNSSLERSMRSCKVPTRNIFLAYIYIALIMKQVIKENRGSAWMSAEWIDLWTIFVMINLSPIQKLQSHDLSDITCGCFVWRNRSHRFQYCKVPALQTVCLWQGRLAENGESGRPTGDLRSLYYSYICDMSDFLSRFCNPVLSEADWTIWISINGRIHKRRFKLMWTSLST